MHRQRHIHWLGILSDTACLSACLGRRDHLHLAAVPRERARSVVFVQFPWQRTAGCPAVPLALWQGRRGPAVRGWPELISDGPRI